MPQRLLVEPMDDRVIVEHVFLSQLLVEHLTAREHAVLALRYSKYTKTEIGLLLGIGRTTVYMTERGALEKLRTLYRLNEQEEEWQTRTDALSAATPSPGSSPSAPAAKKHTGELPKSGPIG